MDKAREGPKPDEMDSSTVGHPPDAQHQAETEITRTDSGEATASRQPGKAEGTPPTPEKAEDEYVLEREPDGRYRITGRRPRKQE